MCCRTQKPFWDDVPVEKAYEDAEINEHGYISVCFSLRLLYFTMAAVNRRDISKAGYQAALTELKRHWYERGECLFTVSVETCNTVSLFQSEIFQHLSQTNVSLSDWINSLLYRGKGRQIRSPMASVSLVSSPPAPVLDKNMKDSELAGDERSSNILVQLLIRSSVRFSFSAVGLHACVTVFSFNHELRDIETFHFFFPPLLTFFCMPLWCSWMALFTQPRLHITVSMRLIHDHFHAT